MANIIESRVTLEDEVFEETIDTAEEPIEVVRPSSYNDLQDLPQVNGVTLQGNKTSSDLGIVTQNDINSAVSAEATLRENADTALGGRIDQEITDRSEAEIALGGRIDGEITNRTNADNALGTRIDNEILARQGGDNNLQTQIDAITSKSDVVDVVATYADLQAYDTQHLGNNDVIKVLDDETHDHSQTYYRWNKPNSTWTYIGSEAPYYSKSQIDTQMAQKQDKLVAGSNIQIASDGKTISATDTTYTAGNGLNLTGTEFSADTTVLATKTEVAPKLQTEVVAELPTTGEESKLYLTPKDYTTGTATGNPITISLGEDAGQITSARLDGDTYQQSYAGKNLAFPKTGARTYNGIKATYNPSTYEITVTGTATASWSIPFLGFAQAGLTFPAGTYTLKQRGTLTNGKIGVNFRSGNTTLLEREVRSETLEVTFTLGSDADGGYLFFGSMTANEAVSGTITVQLEAGSTPSSFEPFCGGVPSPNPDYPQQIQTVTGEQTVAINGTDYPIDLGSIELCKLGTYQDYIYKSGDDWKLHKATGKHTWNGEESLAWDSTTPRAYIVESDLNALGINPVFPANNSELPNALNYKFVSKTFAAFYSNAESNGFAMSQSGKNFQFGSKKWSSIEDARADLAGNTTLYALATATDTTITDTNLIAQLEAVRNATLQASNTITNTATGTNLAGDLELGYYEYDPTNRYDKWLWLDLNNNYEKLGS